MTQHRPYPDGLYFTVVHNPLEGVITIDDVAKYPWPNTGDPRRIAGLRDLAVLYRSQGQAVMIKGVLAGIFEMAQRMRGMAQLMMDMASDEALAAALLDKMVELKLAFWEMALPPLRDVVDVISDADDYGTQVSQLISPRMFRRLIKPRLAILFNRIHELAPDAKFFFHSCGNVRPLLPDFIELGVDILNPVHVRGRAWTRSNSTGTLAGISSSGVAASTPRTCCPTGRARSARRCAAQHRGASAGRRLRVLHRPQHPGRCPAGEHRGDVEAVQEYGTY